VDEPVEAAATREEEEEESLLYQEEPVEEEEEAWADTETNRARTTRTMNRERDMASWREKSGEKERGGREVGEVRDERRGGERE